MNNRYTWCISGDPLLSAGMKSLLINTTSLPRQPAANYRTTKVSVVAAGRSFEFLERSC